MDCLEAAAAVKRLLKGKSIDAYFDLGEDEAAKAFMKKADKHGLRSRLHQDNQNAWLARPRPWFVKYALGGLFLLLPLWIAFNLVWGGTFLSRVTTVLLLCFALSVPFVCSVRKEPQSEQTLRQEETLDRWLRIGLPVFVVLLAAVIQELWLGVLLSLLVLGGIGCFLVIRAINRNT